MGNMEEWSTISKLHNYEVYQSHLWRGYWCGRLLDIDKKTIFVVGMPQDDIAVSADKEHTENQTKARFDYYKSLLNTKH